MPKSTSNESVKISELNLVSTLGESDALPITTLAGAGDPSTNGVNLTTLRAALGFNFAYTTTALGLAGSAEGEMFFVYTDSTKQWVQQYLKSAGVAVPAIGTDNLQVTLPTQALLKTNATFLANNYQIAESFAALRLVKPSVEGQQIQLRSYYSGGTEGGGTFIGHLTAGTDDNGTIAAGTGYYWKRSYTGPLTVQMFGAIGNGIADDSLAFQKAALAANARGGGGVYAPTPSVNYRLTFPVFLFNNTELYGDGQMTKIVYENPLYNKGRGGFIIGSSVECGRDLAIAAYNAGTTATAAIRNDSFVNPTLQQYLRDNPSFVQSINCSIHDFYMVAKYTTTALNGGYAVNMCNAMDCSVYNIWGEGWTEIVNFGSDTTPETPSTHNCHAKNITCVVPNTDKTFYSIGFAANSTNFSFKGTKQLSPMVTGTLNGSGIATNVCENFEIDDVFIPNLGATVTSEGILINNAVNGKVNNIRIGGCITAVATYYTLSTMLDSTKWTKITNVHGSNCTNVIALRGKYAVVSNFSGDNYTYDIYFGTSNASNNLVKEEPVAMGFGGTTFPSAYLSNNTVKGWTYKYQYLRPIDLLVNDLSSLTSWDTNKTISTGTTDVTLHTMISPTFKAVSDVRFWLTFFTGSFSNAAGASTATISVRRMVNYDGNINETPYVEFTNTRSSVSDTLADTSLVAQSSGTTPGYTLVSNSANGLVNSLDLLITMKNNVAKNYIKEIRIGGWG